MNRRIRAVVIDDDPSVCKAIHRLLRTAQMEVETYPSGESYLAEPVDPKPDCLVIDIRMTGMSGPELRDRLAAMGRRVPVVFITAHIEEGDCERSGGTPVLHKPFDGRVLLDTIQQVLTA